MCWSTNKHIKMQIADKDISVFKIVTVENDNLIHSFYKNHYVYRLNEPSFEKIKLDKDSCINIGLHCYRRGNVHIKAQFNSVYVYTIIELGCNLHDVILDNFARLYPNLAVLDCIIPKGTTYVQNELDTIVSECLIPKNYEFLSER